MWKDNHSRSSSLLRQRNDGDDEDDEHGDDGDEEHNDDGDEEVNNDGDDEGDDDGQDDVEQWDDFHDDYRWTRKPKEKFIPVRQRSVLMLNEDVIMTQPKPLTHAT